MPHSPLLFSIDGMPRHSLVAESLDGHGGRPAHARTEWYLQLSGVSSCHSSWESGIEVEQLAERKDIYRP